MTSHSGHMTSLSHQAITMNRTFITHILFTLCVYWRDCYSIMEEENCFLWRQEGEVVSEGVRGWEERGRIYTLY